MPDPDASREELLQRLASPLAPDQEKSVRRFLMERDARATPHPIRQPPPGFRENLERLLMLLSPEEAEELFLAVRVLVYLGRLGEARTLLASRGLSVVPESIREEALQRLDRHAAPAPLAARLLLEEGEWRDNGPAVGATLPEGLVVPLETPFFTVGHGQGCDLFLAHGGLSRHRVRFLVDEEGWRVEDQGLGVWVNGFRVESEALDHGDLVHLAQLPFRFEYLWPPRSLRHDGPQPC